MIDHITFQVPKFALEDGHSIDQFVYFFRDLGFDRYEPEEDAPYPLLWFSRGGGQPMIHLVGDGDRELGMGLGHLCIRIDDTKFETLRGSKWVTRDNSEESGRFWVTGPYGIRVEVRRELIAIGGVVDSTVEQASEIFSQCLKIMMERNAHHRGSWEREGWKGTLFNVRRKLERVWDRFWKSNEAQSDLDDAYDLINYTALMIIAMEQGIEGDWFED